MEQSGFVERGDDVRLAWSRCAGAMPTVVFLPGFRSDMQGIKALALRDRCVARGQAMLRLDYSGHGESGATFDQGTIGRWAEDAWLVIEAQAAGPVLLVGSSMGGWIALLLAARLGARLHGLIGIAAAPDFTETLMWQSMTPQEQTRLMTDGRISVPSEHGSPTVVTRALIEDGRRQQVLGAPIPLTCPVRLLQGQLDADVPWETALKLAATITGDDVQCVLVKDGDHRLSRPGDIALLLRSLDALLVKDAA